MVMWYWQHQNCRTDCLECHTVGTDSPESIHIDPVWDGTGRTVAWHQTLSCPCYPSSLPVFSSILFPSPVIEPHYHRSELNDLLPPNITPTRFRSGKKLYWDESSWNPSRTDKYSTLFLESAQSTELQHRTYTKRAPFCHPPHHKYTLPELRHLLLSSLATNHVPCLL